MPTHATAGKYAALAPTLPIYVPEQITTAGSLAANDSTNAIPSAPYKERLAAHVAEVTRLKNEAQTFSAAEALAPEKPEIATALDADTIHGVLNNVIRHVRKNPKLRNPTIVEGLGEWAEKDGYTGMGACVFANLVAALLNHMDAAERERKGMEPADGPVFGTIVVKDRDPDFLNALITASPEHGQALHDIMSGLHYVVACPKFDSKGVVISKDRILDTTPAIAHQPAGHFAEDIFEALPASQQKAGAMEIIAENLGLDKVISKFTNVAKGTVGLTIGEKTMEKLISDILENIGNRCELLERLGSSVTARRGPLLAHNIA